MVYRPTVRYDEIFKKYVDEVFKATSLDRNQIIRLALYAAPFSPLFQTQIKKYKTSSLPSPVWEVTDHGLWMDQSFNKREEGRDVSGNYQEVSTTKQQTSYDGCTKGTRREGEISNPRVFKKEGGITIKIG